MTDHEFHSPEPKTPEQMTTAALNELAHALAVERGRTIGASPQGAAETVIGFLENEEAIPPEQRDMLGHAAYSLRRAQQEKDIEEGDAALDVQRRLDDSSGILANIVKAIEAGHIENPRYIAGLIRDEVYPALQRASRRHAEQSDTVLSRYASSLTDDERRSFRGYQVVKSIDDHVS